MIKKYSCNSFYNSASPSEDKYGTCVKEDEYDDLEAKYKALEARIDELLEINNNLINLVEGMPVHKWHDQYGQRIKDMPEWVAFYVTTKNAQG